MNKVDFSEETANRKLREWATAATNDYIASRPAGTLEHHARQGFTIAQLVELAEIAYLADDLIAEERRVANSKFIPRSEMNLVFNAMYQNFGYVVGFLAHVRHPWYLSRGARDLVSRPRRLPQSVLVAGVGITPLGTGLMLGTEETVRHFMRNRYFVRACGERQRQRVRRIKDHDNIGEHMRLCGFSVTPTAIKNALSVSQKETLLVCRS
jgi:hypothetical protein